MNLTTTISPLISIIVTTKNNELTIKACLDSIQQQTYARIETILVDNNSTDLTIFIAQKYKCKIYTKGPERSAQRNFGASMSTGEYLLFMDSDMTLQYDLIAEGVSILSADTEIKSLFIPEETIAQGYWGRCKKFERDFYLIGDLSAEAVRFFSKKEFLGLGGYDIEQTGSEDWDMSDRMIAKYKYSRTKSRILHDEGDVFLIEQLKKKRYYAKKGINSYILTAPKYRKAIYPFRPSVKKQYVRFLQDPLHALGSILLKSLELVAGFL